MKLTNAMLFGKAIAGGDGGAELPIGVYYLRPEHLPSHYEHVRIDENYYYKVSDEVPTESWEHGVYVQWVTGDGLTPTATAVPLTEETYMKADYGVALMPPNGDLPVYVAFSDEAAALETGMPSAGVWLEVSLFIANWVVFYPKNN